MGPRSGLDGLSGSLGASQGRTRYPWGRASLFSPTALKRPLEGRRLQDLEGHQITRYSRQEPLGESGEVPRRPRHRNAGADSYSCSIFLDKSGDPRVQPLGGFCFCVMGMAPGGEGAAAPAGPRTAAGRTRGGGRRNRGPTPARGPKPPAQTQHRRRARQRRAGGPPAPGAPRRPARRKARGRAQQKERETARRRTIRGTTGRAQLQHRGAQPWGGTTTPPQGVTCDS